MIVYLWHHFAIGLGVGLFYAIYVAYYGKPRALFRFGGDVPLSLGERQRWLQWLLVAYIFEFATSFFVSHALYREIGLSLIEAPALVAGLYVVDRAIMLWHYAPPPDPEGGDKERWADPFAWLKTWWAEAKEEWRQSAEWKATLKAEEREQRRNRFNATTKGK